MNEDSADDCNKMSKASKINIQKSVVNIPRDRSNVQRLDLEHGGTIRYYPQFLSSNEAHALFKEMNDTCEWEHSIVKVRGKEHNTPRLQFHMKDTDTARGSIILYRSGKGLAWTPSMKKIKEDVEKVSFADPAYDEWNKKEKHFNYALFNLYRNGHDYIAWHPDSEANGERCCCVASLSLGAPRKFRLRPIRAGSGWTHEYILASGSLIIMEGDIHRHWKHHVPKQLKVKDARLNITFRIAS